MTAELAKITAREREPGDTLCLEGFCELRQDIRVFALETDVGDAGY